MAKKSAIDKNKKRIQMVEQQKDKRAALKKHTLFERVCLIIRVCFLRDSFIKHNEAVSLLISFIIVSIIEMFS